MRRHADGSDRSNGTAAARDPDARGLAVDVPARARPDAEPAGRSLLDARRRAARLRASSRPVREREPRTCARARRVARRPDACAPAALGRRRHRLDRRHARRRRASSPREHPWIALVQAPAGDAHRTRGGPIVARASSAGVDVAGRAPDVVVKLDADISFEPDHFERLLAAFAAEPAARHRQRHLPRARGRRAGSRAPQHRRAASGAPPAPTGAACLAARAPARGAAWAGTASTSSRPRCAAGRRARSTDLPFRHHRAEGERDGRRWHAVDGARPRARTTWATAAGTSSLRALHHARTEPRRAGDDLGLRQRRASSARAGVLRRGGARPRCAARRACAGCASRRREAIGSAGMTRRRRARRAARLHRRRAPAAALVAARGLGRPRRTPGSSAATRAPTSSRCSRGERVHFAHSPANRSLKNLVRNLVLALAAARPLRPQVVLTTGAAVAVPFAWMARLRGDQGRLRREPRARRAAVAELPARRARRRPRLRPVARAARQRCPRARYAGTVFSDAMILVTVGASQFPFDRLLRARRRRCRSTSRSWSSTGRRALGRRTRAASPFLPLDELAGARPRGARRRHARRRRLDPARARPTASARSSCRACARSARPSTITSSSPRAASPRPGSSRSSRTRPTCRPTRRRAGDSTSIELSSEEPPPRARARGTYVNEVGRGDDRDRRPHPRSRAPAAAVRREGARAHVGARRPRS